MHQDRWGQDVTASSAEAVAAFDETVLAYLGLRMDTGDVMKTAFGHDPEMPMLSITRSYFMQLFCQSGLMGRAQQAIDGAEAAIAKHGATRREEMHLETAKTWLAGDFSRACALWDEILQENPRDVLALRLAHFLHFYLGDTQNTRDSVNRVMYAWDPTVPAYGFVKGMQAFGFEESGNYAAGEAAGREAVEINGEDCWATHAVAHVMEMTGRHEDGIEWLEGLSGNWGGVNNFKYHTWWHLAMYYLEREDFVKVLALYDTEFRAEPTDDHIDIANAVSMLGRLEMRGVDVGGRWEELGEVCARHVDDHLYVFHDAHYIWAMAAAGRTDDVAKFLSGLPSAAASDLTEGRVFRDVGVPLSEAIVACVNKQYGKAVDLLAPVRYQVYRIGGSHAQRDLFAQLLVHAAIADGRFDLARGLISERLERRPGSSLNWRWLGRTLEGLGDNAGASDATKRADELIAA